MKKGQENKKVIGFDMDGVIIDHAIRKVELAKDFGFKIKINQTPSEIIKNLIVPVLTYRDFQRFLYDEPATALSSPLMPGVKFFITRIRKLNIPYFLISRRKNSETAIALLSKRGLWPKYFNKNNAFFVKTPEDKNTKALELGITHYFDDETKVLEKLVNIKNRFLFDHLGVFKNSGYTRVKSWKEVAQLI